MKELSIYIHIPFCIRKCLYCDFLSFPVGKDKDLCKSADIRNNTDIQKSADIRDNIGIQKESDKWNKPKIERYVNLLCQEITASAPSYREHRVISIFWGGGTPSLLPAEEVGRIMDVIRECYQVAQDAEITMEINPETVDGGKMKQYITAGINRISIGLQSADDRELARIGRIHDYRSFLTAYDLARESGFRNINIDLMAALPEQSISSYERTLERVSALAPEHISAYSLILEEGTPLYERRAEYRFPTEEEDREMYLLTREFLASKGYHRYEISNYAREGYECKHNKVYWQRGDYAGFGLGASSMVQNIRWSNPDTLEAYTIYTEQLAEQGVAAESGYVRRLEEKASYEQKPEVAYTPEKQVLTRQEQMEEFMFLGLRMVCGVSAAEFARIFGRPVEDVYGQVIDDLCRKELLVREEDRIRLTDRGLDVSNYAMAQFLFD